MLDREMRYLAASQCWIELPCGGDHCVTADHITTLFPTSPPTGSDMHRRALAGETLRDELDRFERPDGGALWVRREMRPWHDLNGEVGGIIISAEDLTSVVETQHALRASEERLRLGGDGRPYGVFDWDRGPARFCGATNAIKCSAIRSAKSNSARLCGRRAFIRMTGRMPLRRDDGKARAPGIHQRISGHSAGRQHPLGLGSRPVPL